MEKNKFATARKQGAPCQDTQSLRQGPGAWGSEDPFLRTATASTPFLGRTTARIPFLGRTTASTPFLETSGEAHMPGWSLAAPQTLIRHSGRKARHRRQGVAVMVATGTDYGQQAPRSFSSLDHGEEAGPGWLCGT